MSTNTNNNLNGNSLFPNYTTNSLIGNNYSTNTITQQTPMQPQQFFPQPQGNVYMLNSSSESGNIPISGNLSAAICLSDGTLFLKTLQNGSPAILGYKLSPLNSLNTEQKQPDNESKDANIGAILKNFNDRLDKLESITKKKIGEDVSCLI